ncbi:MAG: hypothetical protein GY892_00635, partial [Shimia sp.]|nr:hypothetical protein [Shimia sp.]
NSRKRFFQLSTKITQLSAKTNKINTLQTHPTDKQCPSDKTKVNNQRISELIHRLTARLTSKPKRNTQQPRQNQQRYHVSIAAVSQRWEKRAATGTFLEHEEGVRTKPVTATEGLTADRR